MRALILLAALAAGCTTPYASSHTHTQVKPGVFFVKVTVNRYTDAAKAVEYFHRRARELCDGTEYDFTTEGVVGWGYVTCE